MNKLIWFTQEYMTDRQELQCNLKYPKTAPVNVPYLFDTKNTRSKSSDVLAFSEL